MAEQTSSDLIISLLKSLQENYNDEAARNETLASLKTAVSNVNIVDLPEVLDNPALDILFQCISTIQAENEMDNTAVEILKKFMQLVNPNQAILKFHDVMLVGFQNPNPAVRALVISQLERCLEGHAEGNVDLLCSEYSDLIIGSIKQLTASDLNVYQLTQRFLQKMIRTNTGRKFLLGPAGISTIKTILDSPSTTITIKLRVFEVLIKFGNESKDILLQLEDDHELITKPLTELIFNGNDPLGQLNGLELLGDLADSKHGLELIERTIDSTFLSIKNLCNNWKEEPIHKLILPGVIKFIGKVGVVQLPHEELVDLVIDSILDSANEFFIATLGTEAIAYIGSSPQGRSFLHLKPNFKKALERIQWLVAESPYEFRARILNGLSVLFGNIVEGEGTIVQADNVQNYLENWFHCIFPKNSTLFTLVQQTFPDVRLAALHLIESVAHLQWAQNFYLRIPGVVEFLLQRNIEPNYECAVVKFEIVKIIISSSSTKKFLTEDDVGRLKIHVDQGLNWIEAIPTMETEGI